eukprot:CAMPEP_0172469274 /NCGR_PEP_ID=MMETSP1065-20121228/63362_1 /TAXON_ID=265537 /ORGANISM="Amphiprora paludosa, Strain CCMP125" /LENGTH=732 /DNA_ID=CAMNT_0013226907 /DNA_START=115 /DNA_END=2313 /DNA_ORIENTATION=+
MSSEDTSSPTANDRIMPPVLKPSDQEKLAQIMAEKRHLADLPEVDIDTESVEEDDAINEEDGENSAMQPIIKARGPDEKGIISDEEEILFDSDDDEDESYADSEEDAPTATKKKTVEEEKVSAETKEAKEEKIAAKETETPDEIPSTKVIPEPEPQTLSSSPPQSQRQTVLHVKQPTPLAPQRPPVVRFYLEGEDHVCRRINLNRIRQETSDANDDTEPRYSMKKVQSLAAETFKLHPSQISLSYLGGGERAFLLDDADLAEALDEVKLAALAYADNRHQYHQHSDPGNNVRTMMGLDIYVTQVKYSTVFIKVELPETSDGFRLIDVERVLTADRQPSLQLLQSVVSETLGASTALRFAYVRADTSRFVLANDLDLKDAFVSCKEDEIVIQSFYSENGNTNQHKNMQSSSEQHGEDEEKQDAPIKMVDEEAHDAALERIEQLEQLVSKQTQMIIATQTQIRALDEHRQNQFMELKSSVDEVGERSTEGIERVEILKKVMSETLPKLQEMDFESLEERVKKLEEQVETTLPKLETVVMGAITATKELNEKVKRQNSGPAKVEFVGKERLQALEEKVATISEAVEELSEETSEISAAEEKAAQELGDRLKRIEATFKQQKMGEKKNGSSSSMDNQQQSQLLERLKSLEESIGAMNKAAEKPRPTEVMKSTPVGPSPFIPSPATRAPPPVGAPPPLPPPLINVRSNVIDADATVAAKPNEINVGSPPVSSLPSLV